MSKSDHNASAGRRPSLMDAAPSVPSDPRHSMEPTRVLADLSGHKSPGISGGMIAVACCIVALGVGAGFWATSGPPKPVVAVVAPSAPSSPAPASAPAATAPAIVAEAPKPALAALPPQKVEPAPVNEPSVAKTVPDEPAAPGKAVVAKGIASTPAVVPKATAAAAVAIAAKAKTPAASKPAADKPVKLAASKPAEKHASAKQIRQSTHAAAAREKVQAAGKPNRTVVAKTRDDKRREATQPAVRKHTDPDTDLLAAMLRRNGGSQQ